VSIFSKARRLRSRAASELMIVKGGERRDCVLCKGKARTPYSSENISRDPCAGFVDLFDG
jgi:hypothetical protein